MATLKGCKVKDALILFGEPDARPLLEVFCPDAIILFGDQEGDLDKNQRQGPVVQLLCDAVGNEQLLDALGISHRELLDDESTGSYSFWPSKNLRVEVYTKGLLSFLYRAGGDHPMRPG